MAESGGLGVSARAAASSARQAGERLSGRPNAAWRSEVLAVGLDAGDLWSATVSDGAEASWAAPAVGGVVGERGRKFCRSVRVNSRAARAGRSLVRRARDGGEEGRRGGDSDRRRRRSTGGRASKRRRAGGGEYGLRAVRRGGSRGQVVSSQSEREREAERERRLSRERRGSRSRRVSGGDQPRGVRGRGRERERERCLVGGRVWMTARAPSTKLPTMEGVGVAGTAAGAVAGGAGYSGRRGRSGAVGGVGPQGGGAEVAFLAARMRAA